MESAAVPIATREPVGLNFVENPWQCSFAVDHLTDLVEEAVYRVESIARQNENIFSALMQAVKKHSLWEISHALYDVGGAYQKKRVIHPSLDTAGREGRKTAVNSRHNVHVASIWRIASQSQELEK